MEVTFIQVHTFTENILECYGAMTATGKSSQ